jgi:hypothetical protein
MHRHLNPTINNDTTYPKQTTLTSLTAKRSHPSATLLTLKLNKRFRKQFNIPMITTIHVSEPTHLACFWLLSQGKT